CEALHDIRRCSTGTGTNSDLELGRDVVDQAIGLQVGQRVVATGVGVVRLFGNLDDLEVRLASAVLASCRDAGHREHLNGGQDAQDDDDDQQFNEREALVLLCLLNVVFHD